MKELKSEKDVKAEIKKILVLHQAWFFMPVQTGYGVQGVPDFVVCRQGKFIGIEAKFGRREETAWQKKQGAAISDASGAYLVVNERNLDSLSGVLALI